MGPKKPAVPEAPGAQPGLHGMYLIVLAGFLDGIDDFHSVQGQVRTAAVGTASRIAHAMSTTARPRQLLWQGSRLPLSAGTLGSVSLKPWVNGTRKTSLGFPVRTRVTWLSQPPKKLGIRHGQDAFSSQNFHPGSFREESLEQRVRLP